MFGALAYDPLTGQSIDPETDPATITKPAEMRAYNPTFSERVGSTIQDALMGLGADPYKAGHMAHGIRDILQWTPAGIPMAAGDMKHAMGEGDVAGTVLGAAGAMIPAVKPVARAVSELAAPYHALLEQAPKEVYNAAHVAETAAPAVAQAAAPEAAVDVGRGLAGSAGGDEGLQQAIAQAERRAAGRVALPGLPAKPQHFDGEYFAPGPVGSVHDVADRYMASRELPSYHKPPEQYHPIDEEHSAAIARAFDEMQHTPDDPATKASYEALVKETLDQYRAIKDSGLKITPTGAADYPYVGNPRAVAKDIADNNHMAFFKTSEGFGSDGKPADPTHPMMQPSGEKIGDHELLNNDIFRIVHDYFGHVKNGYGFRAAGEDNAWRSHAAMYSDLARPAMTTETRGQNSWVNYGPHGEFNRTASGAATKYAEQKVGLMPEWTMRDRGSPEPIIAYHGSPYSFDKFDMSKIGAGEGNQAYGHGLYFAGHSPVSEWYRHQLAVRRDPLLGKYGLDSEQGAHLGVHLASHDGDIMKVAQDLHGEIEALKAEGKTDKSTQNMIKARESKLAYITDPARATGTMYQVAIDHPAHKFLDWDKPLKEQPEVLEAMRKVVPEWLRSPFEKNVDHGISGGNALHNYVVSEQKSDSLLIPKNQRASRALRDAGVPGIRYLDQGSRGMGKGTHNYVTFDAPRLLRKYAVPGMIGAGGFGSLAPGDEQ